MAYSVPPFPIPSVWRNQAPYGFRERKVLPISDGEPRHWPGKDSYRPSDERNYILQLATSWATEENEAELGVVYYLDKLPAGYTCFEIDKPGGNQTYKRLFGHPSGRFYDSIRRFEVHFLWLMRGMRNDCECILCNTVTQKPFVPRPTVSRQTSDRHLSKDRRRTRDIDEGDSSARSDSIGPITAERAQRKGRRQAHQAQVSQFVDEEGTEDIWRDCVRRLENSAGAIHGIEIDIEEPGSMDWKAERTCLPRYITQIDQQHSFVPRVGELVLWCPDWHDNHFLVRHPGTDEYKFYSFEEKCFRGFPLWRGGVVAAVPTAIAQNGPIDFADILETPSKKTSYNTAGFRIETVPDPNNDMDKFCSKQYKYVPLRNIRPLSHWKLLLKGIDQRTLHESVTNSLTNMTSISLVDKWRFNGSWPHGTIFSRGIYLGAELITVGDAVRLKSSEPATAQPGCTDVLIVESIRYHLRDCKIEHTTPQSPQLCSQSLVTFVGQTYTTDLRRAHDMLNEESSNSTETVSEPRPMSHGDVKSLFRPIGTNDYGPWYPLHISHKRYEVSHEQVLGRLYEADAVRLWCGLCQTSLPNGNTKLMRPDLDYDVESILRGRKYATQSDARLPEPGTNMTGWHIEDSRAQALTIATINGLEIGLYHGLRTPATLKSWRAHLKIAEGAKPEDPILQDLIVENPIKLAERRTKNTSKRRGRPQGSKLMNGKLHLANERAEGQLETDDNGETHPISHVEKQHSSQMEIAALVISDEEEMLEDMNYESKGDIHQTSPIIKEETRHPFRYFSSNVQNSAVQEIDNSSGVGQPARSESSLSNPRSNSQHLIIPRSRSRSGSVRALPLSSRITVDQLGQADHSPYAVRLSPGTVALQLAELHNMSSMQKTHRDMLSVDNESKGSSNSSVDEDDEVVEEDDNYENDDDDDEDYDDWADPRNARGGTEESEGGDYLPSQ